MTKCVTDSQYKHGLLLNLGVIDSNKSTFQNMAEINKKKFENCKKLVLETNQSVSNQTGGKKVNNVKNCEIALVITTIHTSVILKGQRRNGKLIKRQPQDETIQAKMLKDRKNLKGRKKNQDENGCMKRSPKEN